MSGLRNINHPGVQIRENDLSQYTPLVGGTTTLVTGFASKGEDNLPQEITTNNAFLSYYGTPSNEAERYLYYSVNQILSQTGRCFIGKIPYQNAATGIYYKNTYSVATSSPISTAFAPSSAYKASDFTGYSGVHVISSPTITSIAVSAVDNYRTGTTEPAANTFELIDKTRSVLGVNLLSQATSGGNEVIGYFPVVITATNALPYQNMLTLSGFTNDPSMAWMAISGITTASTAVNTSDLSISLATSSINDNTLSKTLALQFPSIAFNDAGQIDNSYMDKIVVAIITMQNDPNQNNKITFTIAESFVGSLDVNSKNESGATNYIGNIINSNSKYVEFYATLNAANLVTTGQMYKSATQTAGIYGFTSLQTVKNISSSLILTSLDTIMDRISNINEVELDLVVDAGISNIAQYCTDTYDTSAGIYDPDGIVGAAWAGTATSRDNTLVWRTVIGKYLTFCSTTRKDCMAIVDGLRTLVLAGSQKLVRPGATTTVDIDILGNLKNITGINSNYGAMYINWFKTVDTFTGNSFWLPPSIDANGIYIYTDTNSNYWDAPAGLNRGVVFSAVDVAFNPNGTQEDAIYSKSFNYAVNYPYDGIVLTGQKTLQTKPSAFDRVNVRRLFLKLERFTYKTARYYVEEPSNLYTWTRLVDQLTPIYEDAKSRGGIFDYQIICSTQNNTPTTIDNNELRLAVLIKPTKTAEFIVVDFYPLSTGMSFSEVSI